MEYSNSTKILHMEKNTKQEISNAEITPIYHSTAYIVEDTLICSSGMATISSTLLSLLKSGDHIIFNKEIYGEIIEFSHNILAAYHIEISFVDFASPQQIEDALQDNTRILYTEVISNPVMLLGC